MIASDLDGTLLDGESRLSEGTLRELERVMALGVRVVLCSGRSPGSTRPFAEAARVNAPYVTSNGAQIVDPATHRVIDEVDFTPEQAARCARFAEERGLHVQAYDAGGFYSEQPCPLAADYAASTGLKWRAVNGRLSGHLVMPCCKLILIMPGALNARVLEQAERELSGVAQITTSSDAMVEFEPPGVSKASGLERLARRLGIGRREVAAFGDAMNDLSMLRWAGVGVAMANARDELKREADDVCPPHTEDGVAAWLRAHIQPVPDSDSRR